MAVVTAVWCCGIVVVVVAVGTVVRVISLIVLKMLYLSVFLLG